MPLSGTLETMALPDLLQWIAVAQKSGVLELRNGSVCKTLYLEKGNLIATASDDRNEMLGQFLLARGSIDEEQLAQGLRAQQKSRVFLGKILVMCGMLEEEELRRALAQKAEETVFSLFEWEEGKFELREDEGPDQQVVPISLRMEDVLLRGVQRFDELQRIREVFPDGQVVLARTERALPRQVMKHPLALRILDRVDEARTIDEITLDAHASPFQVRKFLFECHRVGLVEIVERRGRAEARTPALEASTEALAPLARRARRLLEEGECEGCLVLLREILEADPDHAEAQELVESAEAAFTEQISRSVLPPEAVPRLNRPLEEVTSENMKPEEFFLLSRIDGSWDVKSIIDIAPMREAEALRVLKRLLQQGVIRVEAARAAAEGQVPG